MPISNMPAVAGTLRRAASIDFRRAEAVPLEGLADPVVLALAAEEGRVLVSHDVNTIERHFQDFIQKQTSPASLIKEKRHLLLDGGAVGQGVVDVDLGDDFHGFAVEQGLLVDPLL